jgi:L-ribulokinase
MSQDNFCIGVDFGTDSVRVLVVDAADGSTHGVSTYAFPQWGEGEFCDPVASRFRQHPGEHVLGLEMSINKALDRAGDRVRRNVRAISVATTGSSPLAVDVSGTPLAFRPEFDADPDAMVILWKDHTAIAEAAVINAHAAKQSINYLQFVGGVYSSEWYWAKALHVLRTNENLRKAAFCFVEHADWLPFLLTGGTDIRALKRGVCTAGHKGLWSQRWGGFPPDDFFSSLDPLLTGQVARLGNAVFTADQAAGKLSPEWTARLGLEPGVIVGVGAMDAHMGAVGGQIEPYYLSKVMGTSTCDMLVAPANEMAGKFVKGICGLVDGSIVPGMIGMEAGQSAFGDVYAWFRDLLSWPLRHLLQGDSGNAIERIIPELSRQAEALAVDEQSELALDWLNGRRTPDANAALKGAITGLSLGSDAPRVFRALAEATAFGARAIVERFREQGVPVKGLIGIGGISRKSPYLMQLLADVTGMSILINQSEQTCALGAAMFAATVAGIYPRVEDAMAAMGHGFDQTYHPVQAKKALYDGRYRRYQELGEHIMAQTTK